MRKCGQLCLGEREGQTQQVPCGREGITLAIGEEEKPEDVWNNGIELIFSNVTPTRSNQARGGEEERHLLMSEKMHEGVQGESLTGGTHREGTQQQGAHGCLDEKCPFPWFLCLVACYARWS